jgi:hypothetical protein
MAQEEITRDKELDTETIEDAQDCVEKNDEEAVEEKENIQAHIEDSSLQQALDSFYSRGRKPRSSSGVTRRIRGGSSIDPGRKMRIEDLRRVEKVDEVCIKYGVPARDGGGGYIICSMCKYVYVWQYFVYIQ